MVALVMIVRPTFGTVGLPWLAFLLGESLRKDSYAAAQLRDIPRPDVTTHTNVTDPRGRAEIIGTIYKIKFQILSNVAQSSRYVTFRNLFMTR
jgi:hypothetical protein